MKTTAYIVPVLVLSLFCFQLTFSQEGTRWKKVTKSNFENPYPDQYPDAEAVILYQEGSAHFEMYNEEFCLLYDGFVRILILNKEGYKWADIEIGYYPYHDIEEIISIDGYTYNYDHGKILKEKLRGSNIFDEDVDGKWHRKKFSMPAVKEGSIIEYRYTIRSYSFTYFRDWDFQHTIPTVYSKYTTRIPDYLKYSAIVKGMEQLELKDTKQYHDIFKFAVHQPMTVLNQQREHSYNEVKYTRTHTDYLIRDVPPIEEEPFSTCIEDFRTKVVFQLVKTNFPGRENKIYMTNWQDLVNKLFNQEHFGGQLSGNAFLKKEAEHLTSGIEDPLEKMKTIYDYVRSSMKWDERYGMYTYQSLKKAWEQKRGNGAEINLILTEMLEKAGLNSYPVILSTRGCEYKNHDS